MNYELGSGEVGIMNYELGSGEWEVGSGVVGEFN